MDRVLITVLSVIMLTSITFYVLSSQKSSNLVEVQSVNPNIRIELWYATNKNFTGKQIYPVEKCYLIKEVAEALDRVQKELEKQGLGLKIWDGYRPLSAQCKLWNVLSDERYVSDPRKGGRHTRGTAVDLTIVRLSDGNELEMPTGFDDFTEKAWRTYQDLPENVKKNRLLLQHVMERHGFIGLKTEWWHFDWRGWKNYQKLDIMFSKSSKPKKKY